MLGYSGLRLTSGPWSTSESISQSHHFYWKRPLLIQPCSAQPKSRYNHVIVGKIVPIACPWAPGVCSCSQRDAGRVLAASILWKGHSSELSARGHRCARTGEHQPPQPAAKGVLQTAELKHLNPRHPMHLPQEQKPLQWPERKGDRSHEAPAADLAPAPRISERLFSRSSSSFQC